MKLLTPARHILLIKKKALTALKLAEPVLRKHKMKLGLENHKDWLAKELVASTSAAQ
jgi:hypothetical protein